MKKSGITLCIVSSIIILVNASVYEGSAILSSNNSDLPESGFYAATNSFPRNTVVDVTNLENGKTVRVIVSAGLDSPGLLTILSKEAAAAIGLGRSVGRVRLTQPADPIAFSRFTEGLNSSGDPDYDPRAFIESDSGGRAPDRKPGSPAWQGVLNLDEISNQPASQAGDLPEPVQPGAAKTPNANNPPVLVAGELPETYEPPAASAVDEGIIPEPSPDLAWREPANRNAPEQALPETGNNPLYIVQVPVTPYIVLDGGAQAAAPSMVSPGDYEFSMIPAEERPPAGGAVSVQEFQPPAGQLAEEEPEIDTSLFVTPVEQGKETGVTIQEPLPQEIPAQFPPETPPAVEPPKGDFSVPVIAGLERGKFYLQLGTYSRMDMVENEIAKIEKYYPLSIQSSGSPERPVYRILIGPVNRGESAALLQRFKGSGYRDAFVRQGS